MKTKKEGLDLKMNGIIPLWKECGMTSHDCVFKVRKLLHMKKVGHAGTLDPNVDGLLPICLGRGTKLVDLLHESNKTYVGEITLGKATTTEDSDGDVIEEKDVVAPLSIDVIDQAMKEMEGEIIQIPPMYSAVKVNGKRLYQYARENIEVERPQRQATIVQFKRLSEPVYHEESQTQSWSFIVTCSKGTYVRTLAVDLGKKLGYPSYMSSLTRIESGGYKVKEAITLDKLAQHVEEGALDTVVQPLETVVRQLQCYDLTEDEYRKVSNGVRLPKEMVQPEPTSYVAMMYQGRLIAIYEPKEKQLVLWRMIEVK